MTDLISFRYLQNKECAHGQSLTVFCFDCYMLEKWFKLDPLQRDIYNNYKRSVNSGNLKLMDYYLDEIIEMKL